MGQERSACDSNKRLRYRLSDRSQPRRKTASKNGNRDIGESIIQVKKDFDLGDVDNPVVLSVVTFDYQHVPKVRNSKFYF